MNLDEAIAEAFRAVPPGRTAFSYASMGDGVRMVIAYGGVTGNARNKIAWSTELSRADTETMVRNLCKCAGLPKPWAE